MVRMTREYEFGRSKATINENEEGFTVNCECGWNSDVMSSEEDAVIAFESHVKSNPRHKMAKESEGANFLSIFLAALGFLYIISPIDFVPDYLVGVGWMEDILIGVICFILAKGGVNGQSPIEVISDIFT